MRSLKQLLIIFLCASSTVIAQESSETNVNYLAPAPTASGMGKFGAVPVSYHTGTPNIQQPIYTVTEGKLQLPIGLSYHASGLQVDELASNTGLGWSLAAGGIITRTVKGLPDNDFDGYFEHRQHFDTYKQQNPQSANNSVLQHLADGLWDVQPDLFLFNFGGQAGRIVFLEDPSTEQPFGTAVTNPRTDFLVDYTTASETIAWQTRLRITGFTITDRSGTVWEFGGSSKTRSTSDDGNGGRPFYQSWHLRSVTPYDQTSTISLEYETHTINYPVVLLSETWKGLSPGNSNVQCLYAADPNQTIQKWSFPRTMHTQKIKRILFSEGEVLFQYQTQRADLSGGLALDAIELYRTIGSTPERIKKWALSYSYFNANNSDGNDLRLMLQSIQEFGRTDADHQPPHLFEYYSPDGLPSPNSGSRDAWGFYNGLADLGTLLPANQLISVGGANLNATSDPAIAQTAMLKRITYPTGGTTTFEYEPNVAYGSPPLEQLFPLQGTDVLSHYDTLWFDEDSTLVTGEFADYLMAPFPADSVWVIILNDSCWSVDDTVYCGPNVPEYLLLPKFDAPKTNHTVGGVRILRITSDNGVGNAFTKRYEYNDYSTDLEPITNELLAYNNEVLSSGRLRSIPHFLSGTRFFVSYTEQGSTAPSCDWCDYLFVTSFNINPLAGSGGGHIGYETVSVHMDGAPDDPQRASEMGKSVFWFQPVDVFVQQRPFTNEVEDPFSGRLLEEAHYRREAGGDFKPVSAKQYVWNPTIDGPTVSSLSVSVSVDESSYMPFNGCDGIIPQYYTVLSDSYRPGSYTTLASLTETQWGSDNQPLSFTTDFTYNGPAQLRSKAITNSDGSTFREYYEYAGDFTDQIAQQQVALNLNFTPVKTVRTVQGPASGDPELSLGSKILHFGDFTGNGKSLYIDHIEEQLLDAPIATTATPEYRITKRFEHYNAKGLPTQMRTENDVPSALVYGHNGSYPIAQVTNAHAADVFYTGFESMAMPGLLLDINNSNAAAARTGNYSRSVQFGNGPEYNLTPDNQHGGYTVSGWVNAPAGFDTNGGRLHVFTTNAAGGPLYPADPSTAESIVDFSGTAGLWVRIETTIDLQAIRQANGLANSEQLTIRMVWYNFDNSVAFLLDDIRIKPTDALMKTQAFDPLVGLIAESDINDRAVRFEYDNLGRLIAAWDHEGYLAEHTAYIHTQGGSTSAVSRKTPLVPVSSLSAFAALAPSDISERIGYLDGLGRTVQEIAVQASPTQNDLVQFHEVDAFGRELRNYLPYAAGDGTGAMRQNPAGEAQQFYQDAKRIAHTGIPWSEVSYEASPMSRVLAAFPAGEDWQQDHGTQATRHLIAANAVRLWTGTGSQCVSATCYDAATLSVVENTDENGNISRTYTDLKGRVVMQEQELAASGNSGSKHAQATPPIGSAQTYFVYDAFDQLVTVIPPMAVAEMHASGHWDCSTLTGDYLYVSTYDNMGRLVEKDVPGADPVWLVYDNLDRPILSQDGNQRTRDEWQFVRFDVYGRTILTGLHTNRLYTTRTDMQEAADNWYATSGHSNAERPVAAGDPELHGYSNLSFPPLIFQDLGNAAKQGQPSVMLDFEVHTVSWYDDYDTDNDGTADLVPATVSGWTIPAPDAATTGMATGSAVRVLDGATTATWLTSASFYDHRGHVVLEQSDNPLGGTDAALHTFDFNNRELETHSVHRLGTSNELRVHNRFEYDRLGRLLQEYQINGTDPEVLVAAYTYNELGQLIEHNMHSTDQGISFLQSVDYSWNPRGWLTHINNADLENDRAKTLESIKVEIYERLDNTTTSTGAPAEAMFANTIVHWTDGTNTLRLGQQETRLLQKALADPAIYNELKTIDGTALSVQFNGLLLEDNAVLNNAHAQLMSGITAQLTSLGIATQSTKTSCGQQACATLSQTIDNPSSFTNDDSNDLFGMELTYTNPGTAHNADARYDGSVAEVLWQSASDGVKRGYGVQYDKLNRMVSANYSAWNATMKKWGAEAGHYSVSGIQYDLHGNLLTLARNGYTQGNSFGAMDVLSYGYNGNQLRWAEDAAPTNGYNDFTDHGTHSATEYHYDANGNLVADDNKGIIVLYNHLNLPTTVQFASGAVLQFVYDAVGATLSRSATDAAGNTTNRWYSNGVVYNDNGLEFFGSSSGRVVPAGNGASTAFLYEYHITDHQGNLRLAFSDLDGDGQATPSEIIQEAHYYPFGLQMQGLATPASGPQHPFRYNGGEHLDAFGLNWHHLGARMLDPQLGRWHGIDPVDRYNLSPYNAMDNSPLTIIDPAGTYGSHPSSNSSYSSLMGTAYDTYYQHAAWSYFVSQNGYTPWLTPEAVLDHGLHQQWNTPEWLLKAIAIGDAYGLKGTIDVTPAGGIYFNANVQNTAHAWHLGGARPDPGFLAGVGDGFAAGVNDTWQFLKSLTTVQGWKDLAEGTATMAVLVGTHTVLAPVLMPMEMQAVAQAPSRERTWYEVGYQTGYIGEKVVEAIVLRKAVGGRSINFQAGRQQAQSAGVVTGFMGDAAKESSRAFWSGAGSEASALSKGYQTLGQTRAGQNLATLTADMPYYPGSQAYNMWARLSTTYAKGAKGTVHVFQNAEQGVGMQSIWRLYEYPALQANPNVTNIIFHY